MTLETVDSDVIHAIGYDAEIQVLEIIFNNGRIYQYRDVPLEVYKALMAADSKGNYFNDNVRGEFDFWEWDVEAVRFVRGVNRGVTGIP